MPSAATWDASPWRTRWTWMAPHGLSYTSTSTVWGEGITLNQVAVGCECQDCLWAPAGGCCPGASLHKFAYNDQGQVRLRAGLPIYECNSRCRCGYDCPNRVVQKGIRYDLCIFRTDDGRGWGVRTLEKIRKNSFVMEYVGEVGSRGPMCVYVRARGSSSCRMFPSCVPSSPHCMPSASLLFLSRERWGAASLSVTGTS